MSKWIDIEVEVGRSFTFEIVQESNGFWISYDSENFEGWEPSRSDLDWVLEAIKKVMKELNIQASHFALHLVLFGGLGPNNPTCCVNKRKDVIYLRLPIDVVNGQLCLSVGIEIHDDYVFYHELMHAKDCLRGYFPSSGFMNPTKNPELALITSLWHFSIEGRLEKNNKPHKTQQNVIDDEYFWASAIGKIPGVTKEFFQKACDKLWGKEVTFQELQSYAEALKAMKE